MIAARIADTGQPEISPYNKDEANANNHPTFCDSIYKTQGVSENMILAIPPINNAIRPICMPDIANK